MQMISKNMIEKKPPKPVQKVLKSGVISSQRLMWQCEVMIKGANSKRVLSEWLSRGGKRPGGVQQGVERLSFLRCCTWSCGGALLWLYTICLLGFNHMRQNACGFTGKKYRLYYTQGCLCGTAPDKRGRLKLRSQKKKENTCRVLEGSSSDLSKATD